MKVFVRLCALLWAGSLLAQTPPCITPSQRAAIIAGDRFTTDTLWFGFHSLGTCGIDTALCGEATEWPPPPPTGVFDARWAPISADCIPSPHFDYRGYVSASQADTYIIHLQAGSDEYPPPMLYWNKDSVAQMCDSAVLQDLFGGFLVRKRMDRDSFATFNPIFINQLMLIRYGQRLTPVAQSQDWVPRDLLLFQNFPNPFNPSTIIRFQVPTSCLVTLTVNDLLGREITVLAQGQMKPGVYERTFNAQSLPSGIYFCRLAAASRLQTTKMLVLR
jgi:hypothetical protein